MTKKMNRLMGLALVGIVSVGIGVPAFADVVTPQMTEERIADLLASGTITVEEAALIYDNLENCDGTQESLQILGLELKDGNGGAFGEGNNLDGSGTPEALNLKDGSGAGQEKGNGRAN